MFGGLIDDIGFGIFTAMFTITAKLPLLLIRAIVRIFQLIAFDLPQYLLFGIRNNAPFSTAQLPEMFIRMSIISIIIFFLLFFIGILRAGIYKENQNNPVKVVLKYSVIGTFWIVVLPIALYAFSLISNAVLSLILGSSNKTLDRQIWNGMWSAKEYDISFEKWDKIGENYVFGRDEWNLLKSGQGIMLWFLSLMISVSTLIPLVLGAITLIQKIFQQFVLFIIAPFVAASSLIDEGRRMKMWQEQYITKTIVIIGFVVSIQVFGAFINLAAKWASGMDEDFFTRFLILIVVCVGGAVASMGISALIASFTGESASVRETMAETKGLIAGGAGILAGAKLATKLGEKTFGAVSKGLLSGGKKLGNALGKKSATLSRLGAKASLLGNRLTGKISKDEYTNRKGLLNDEFLHHKSAVSDAQSALHQAEVDYVNNGGSAYDLGRSTNSLIRQESSMEKDLKNIAKEHGTNSKHYKDALKAKGNLSSLIDARMNKDAVVDFNHGKDTNRKQNERRSGALTQEQINELTRQKRYEAYKNRGNQTVAEFKASEANQNVNKYKADTLANVSNANRAQDEIKNKVNKKTNRNYGKGWKH